MPHIAIDVAIDIPHSSAQNGVLGGDECVDGVAQAPMQLVWMFVYSPPLQGRPLHENHGHEKLCSKHLVALSLRFPCAGSSAACNGAVHHESVRTELLLSDMGESHL